MYPTKKLICFDLDGTRYWLATGDERLKPVIDNAFKYYYESDINHFRCFGGAMDCASIALKNTSVAR